MLTTIPPSEITATSDVPPPISTIILPFGFEISIPAPIAAAIGSSIKYVLLAPACIAASITARFSTSVTPLGTQIITLGLNIRLLHILSKKYLSIRSVILKSEITPSRRGRIATMFPGVLPSIRCASTPTARSVFVFISIATTEGSFKTMPLPFIYTSTDAVPRSMPIS